MTRRTSFERGGPGVSRGATDVMPENRDSVLSLRDRVVRAARDVQTALGAIISCPSSPMSTTSWYAN